MIDDEFADVMARYAGVWRIQHDAPTLDTWRRSLISMEYPDVVLAIVDLATMEAYEKFPPKLPAVRARAEARQMERKRLEQASDEQAEAHGKTIAEQERRKQAIEYGARWMPLERRIMHPFTSDRDPVRAAWLAQRPRIRAGVPWDHHEKPPSDPWQLLYELERVAREHPAVRRRATARGAPVVAGFSTMGGAR